MYGCPETRESYDEHLVILRDNPRVQFQATRCQSKSEAKDNWK